MKIFIHGFWGEKQASFIKKSVSGMLYPISFLLAVSIFLGVGAEFVYPYINETAIYLLDPEIYIDAVLKE